MKCKQTILLFVTLILPIALSAQFHLQRDEVLKANSNWFFGEVGINHNQSPTQLINTPQFKNAIFDKPQLRAGEEMIPVSHHITGALRFIVTRNQVFDKNYQAMPNGGFVPNNDVLPTTRTIAVIPIIDEYDKYYLIRTSIVDSLVLTYSIIDMSLNNGLGDIVEDSKNTIITKGYEMELLSVIPGNNCDIWLLTMVFEKENFSFRVYNITRDGINTNPVISNFSSDTRRELFWDFELSPNRSTIAYNNLKYYANGVYDPVNYIHFLNFNVDNGSVTTSHMPSIKMPQISSDIHGTFSPDNNFYLSYAHVISGDSAVIFKYDLREYTNNYRPTKLNYAPFNYIPYNQSRHIVYERPVFLFKHYGKDLYFPVNTSIEVVPPMPPAPDVYNVLRQVSGIGKFSPQNGLFTWDEAFVSFSAPTPDNSIYNTSIPVTYAYQPIDTIPQVAEDSVLCLEQDQGFPKIDMRAKEGFEGYIWNDGTKGPEKSITEPGKYWVIYDGGCGIRVDTFIYKIRTPDKVLPLDTLICEQRFPFTIIPRANATEYLWEDMSTNAKRDIYHPGDYKLTYVLYGCILEDSITITSQFCPCDIFVPNAFSPNNDGLNDYFKPSIGLGCVPLEYSFKIFNRNGQVVYVSFNEFDKGWDGTIKGKPAGIDTYFYEIHFKSRDLNTDNFYQKGQLTLVR